MHGLSADGTVAVGQHNPYGVGVPFRWSIARGLETLGTNDGGAEAISLDGSMVVGYLSGAMLRAFRFTIASGLSLIPVGSLTSTIATAVNSDGTVITGNSSQGVWLWDAVHGARLLKDILAGLGVNTGECYLTVYGISGDGLVLTGNGACLADAEGPWIAHLN